jgi:acyl carrier protein
MTEDVQQLVKEHIETELAGGRPLDLKPDDSLVGIVDSTGVIELMLWIEGTFGFSVEVDDISPDDFGTIRRLSTWIRHAAQKARA